MPSPCHQGSPVTIVIVKHDECALRKMLSSESPRFLSRFASCVLRSRAFHPAFGWGGQLFSSSASPFNSFLDYHFAGALSLSVSLTKGLCTADIQYPCLCLRFTLTQDPPSARSSDPRLVSLQAYIITFLDPHRSNLREEMFILAMVWGHIMVAGMAGPTAAGACGTTHLHLGRSASREPGPKALLILKGRPRWPTSAI